MTIPDISIIVLCWNHLNDVTIPFIEEIKKTKHVNFEVIFVDNGSDDGTQQYLEQLQLPFPTRVIRLDQNYGFNGGNKKGLEAAQSEWILFLNNDVVVTDPKWLLKIYEKRDENKLLGAQLEKGNSYTEFNNKFTPYICGWCLFVHRSFLEKHGSFDMDFGIGYFEDVELSARAVHFGYSLEQVNCGIEHLGSRSSGNQMNIEEQTTINQKIFRNKMYQLNGKRIVFYVPGMYGFTDKDYFGKGVGGAEASLILLARSLAKEGWIVDIYNDTLVEEKTHGVNYRNLKNFSHDDFCDVFILFRNSMEGMDLVNAKVKLFFSCDQRTSNDWEFEILPYINKTIVISEYHKNYLHNHYPIAFDDLKRIDLGINSSDYEHVDMSKKVKGKLLFCSVPRRGLQYLGAIYQRIKILIPYVSLYITSDYTLWGSKDPLNAEFISEFSTLPDVHFLGKVKREVLVEHQKTAEVMVYPGDYDENFCIAAMECIAAGTVPVVTNIGAMETTVAESGILINKMPGHHVYDDLFVEEVVKLLNDRKRLEETRTWGRRRALEKYSWDVIVEKYWRSFLAEMLQESKYMKNYCPICEQQFESAFHFFKHRAEAHFVHSKNPMKAGTPDPRIFVVIKTRKPIELSINNVLEVKMEKEFTVPQEMVSNVIQILNGAYGEDIIEDAQVKQSV